MEIVRRRGVRRARRRRRSRGRPRCRSFRRAGGVLVFCRLFGVRKATLHRCFRSYFVRRKERGRGARSEDSKAGVRGDEGRGLARPTVSWSSSPSTSLATLKLRTRYSRHSHASLGSLAVPSQREPTRATPPAPSPRGLSCLHNPPRRPLQALTPDGTLTQYRPERAPHASRTRERTAGSRRTDLAVAWHLSSD